MLTAELAGERGAHDEGALHFLRDGAQSLRSALNATNLQEISDAIAHLPAAQAGVRIYGIDSLHPLLSSAGPIGAVAASVLGNACQPVRAILFDKTAATNWALGWHQDRTVAVAERIEIDDFGPWTIKSGMHHVAPPFDLLSGMVTLRVHLDRVTASNSPLLIARGSHRLGRIPAADVADVVRHCGIHACLAEACDVWIYATPILHASEAAREPSRRRVLQVDYAVGDLPGGLRWLGV